MAKTAKRFVYVFIAALILAPIFTSSAAAANIRTLIKFENESFLTEYLEINRAKGNKNNYFKRLHPKLLWAYTNSIEEISKNHKGVVAVEYDTKLLEKFLPNPEENSLDVSELAWGVSRIGAPDIWESGYTGHNVLVAVLDSGVNYLHPGLANNMHKNEEEFFGIAGIDDDGNGYVDDVFGYDFYHENAEVMDFHNHGSHVAGTIAANLGSKSIYGVSPSAKILGVKTHDSHGMSSKLTVSEGILYAVDMGADILNCSWSGAPEASRWSQMLYDVLSYAREHNVLVVASAGNEGRYVDIDKAYPSGYELDNVISVGATNKISDNLSAYSNYGIANVHIGAPGTAIYSTDSKNGIVKMTGTSMAAPHVSGAAALVIEYLNRNHFDYTPAHIKEILMNHALKTPGTQNKVTSGLLNVRFLKNKLANDEIKISK